MSLAAFLKSAVVYWLVVSAMIGYGIVYHREYCPQDHGLPDGNYADTMIAVPAIIVAVLFSPKPEYRMTCYDGTKISW